MGARAGASLIVGPSTTGDITTTPFFMDPDYLGDDKSAVNVDGTVTKGTKIADVYGLQNAANKKYKFSFHPSFIGEQVNASIQALPNDVVRYSYVHTVFNYGADPDESLVYPSFGVPEFSLFGTDKVLAAGTLAQPVCSSRTV